MSAGRRRAQEPLDIIDQVLTEVDDELVDWARGVGIVLCPACKRGKLSARFQTFGMLLPNGEFKLDDAPDADYFVGAQCDNEECDFALAEPGGDGRLRRALLTTKSNWGFAVDEDPLGLEHAFIEAVTDLIRRHHDKAGRSH